MTCTQHYGSEKGDINIIYNVMNFHRRLLPKMTA